MRLVSPYLLQLISASDRLQLQKTFFPQCLVCNPNVFLPFLPLREAEVHTHPASCSVPGVEQADLHPVLSQRQGDPDHPLE